MQDGNGWVVARGWRAAAEHRENTVPGGDGTPHPDPWKRHLSPRYWDSRQAGEEGEEEQALVWRQGCAVTIAGFTAT